MNTILLVEDEPDTLQVLEMLLVAEGFRVITAVDGQDGCAKMQQDKPDIVVTDFMMPKCPESSSLGTSDSLRAVKECLSLYSALRRFRHLRDSTMRS
jgi:CheY-like chemotaxis protein